MVAFEFDDGDGGVQLTLTVGETGVVLAKGGIELWLSPTQLRWLVLACGPAALWKIAPSTPWDGPDRGTS